MRTESRCDVCGQVDDHPRCHTYQPNGQIISRHFDCCYCPTCTTTLNDSGGAKGADLIRHLTGG